VDVDPPVVSLAEKESEGRHAIASLSWNLVGVPGPAEILRRRKELRVLIPQRWRKE
jgi:hypothetical protein